MPAFVIIILLASWMAALSSAAKKKAAGKAPQQSKKSEVTENPFHPAAPEAEKVSMPKERVGSMVAQPLVATPMQLDASMRVPSMEGVDPCHPQGEDTRGRLGEQKRMEHRMNVLSEAHNAFDNHREEEGRTLDTSPDGLFQGILMSEILTRPCQKRRKYYR